MRRCALAGSMELMQPAGMRAFEYRNEAKSGIYSYEQKTAAALDPADEKRFRADKKAWEFFLAQPPSYRRLMIWRVISAKKAETKMKRLAALIEA